MAVTLNADVLVVSTDDHLGGQLKQALDRPGWALLEALSLRQSLKQIMKQVIATQPKVVILPVAQMTDRALQLIRLLQSGYRRMSVIVTTPQHSDELEREVRTSGATCYVPGGMAAVDEYVEMLQEAPARRAAASGGAGARCTAGKAEVVEAPDALPIDQTMDYLDSSSIVLDESQSSKKSKSQALDSTSHRMRRAS